ncbi:MAG: hypothetical protein ACRERC_27285 [Candidatus Binatia bacterium]
MPIICRAAVVALLLLAACAPKPPAAQTYIGGQPIDPQELTAAEVARAVRISPRGVDVFFQAPPIQATKVIDLRRAGQEIGVNLGEVERVRYGYLFGVLNRANGEMKHYLLFQSNFVEGHDRYAAVNLPDGRPLTFSLSRAQDPCVPNCFPVLEALIVALPPDVVRAGAATGLPLTITLTDGETIATRGIPAYVQGYLQAVDSYAAR